MSLMVSISGIRGVVGSTLTPEIIVKYTSAYAEYCKRGTIIIGQDGRITGPAIAKIVSSTLQSMGSNVISLGVCPTPTVALAVERLHAAGGISITASHNPMIWNGMKFFAPSGLFLDAEENKVFWSIAERASREYVPWDRQGTFESRETFLDEHIQSVLALPFLDLVTIKQRKFKIVLDCVNAAGCSIVPRLLQQFGCEVIPLHCEMTGVFGHTPEPIPENLTDLRNRVRETGADLGIAVDPDVDRLVLIDERGEPHGEEYTITACVDFVLTKLRTPNPRVVVNSLSDGPEDLVLLRIQK
jgi:phosphomannomutase